MLAHPIEQSSNVLWRAALVWLMLVVCCPRPAIAQPLPTVSKPSPDAPSSEQTEQRAKARESFLRGTELVRDARWAEALSAFEAANATLPHAITIYNIGACQRALGRYTLARQSLQKALAENASKRTELPSDLVDDAKAFLVEIDHALSRVTVTAKPAAALLLDGRPLLTTDRAAPSQDLPGPRVQAKPPFEVPVLVAGVLPPGPGSEPPSSTFIIEMDPGSHVLAFVRKGFSDALIRKEFISGSNPPLDLTLDQLPATLSVSANERGALVSLDGKDLGPVPVALNRPAGSHKVRVEKRGFVPYETLLTLKAGEQTSFRAKLAKRDQPLYEKWWFWTVTSAALTGVGVGTYFAARPAPTRPNVGGGSLGWRVDIP